MRRLWGLTFEFTRPAEAGVVSPACDDATAGTRRAYNACRSGSGVQRGVRHHRPPSWRETTNTWTPDMEHSSLEASFRVMTSILTPDFSMNTT